ncbi:hypothetical protein CFB49_26750 [Burkholderia sp. AU17457]|nr:hypothetical protein CFB49_26750 [Burkholderia sp. AU17457]
MTKHDALPAAGRAAVMRCDAGPLSRAVVRVAFVGRPAAVVAAGGAPGALHLDVAPIVWGRMRGRQTIFPHRVMRDRHQLVSDRDVSAYPSVGFGSVQYRRGNRPVRAADFLRFWNEVVS